MPGKQSSSEELISESILPRPGSFDAAAMGRGEAGLPHVFKWRDEEYTVARLIATWKTSGKERGGTEIYLRRHWFDIETTTGERMTLYCDRQAKNSRKPKARWWLYTVTAANSNSSRQS
jgi:hypothetical protein